MKKPTIISVLADNGQHSHWALIETETGNKLWSEDSEECKTMGYPVEENKILSVDEIDKMAREELKNFSTLQVQSLFQMGTAFIDIYKAAFKDGLSYKS